MDADIKTWLFDIQKAIDEIKLFIESVADDFSSDEKDTKHVGRWKETYVLLVRQ